MRSRRQCDLCSIDNMRAQHFVLDLNLVGGVEEDLVAVEQRRSHRVGVPMDQASSLESLPASFGIRLTCHSIHHSLWLWMCTVLNTASAQNQNYVLRSPRSIARTALSGSALVT